MEVGASWLVAATLRTCEGGAVSPCSLVVFILFLDPLKLLRPLPAPVLFFRIFRPNLGLVIYNINTLLIILGLNLLKPFPLCSIFVRDVAFKCHSELVQLFYFSAEFSSDY